MLSNYRFWVFFVVFGLFVNLSTLAQSVKGKISDIKGNPIPYATIYIPSLHKGTTANESGEYQLSLEKGDYDVVFQYLGYKTKNTSVSISSFNVVLDVILEQQHYNLAEVIITASGEDPAYFIMRKAIGMSQYYRNQVSEYTAKVYLKGTGVATKIPMLLRSQLKKDGIEVGKYFVTETLSEISYIKGEEFQTKVISMRSSGQDNETSPMQFVALSLYDDINGIISPLSRSAFQVYKFKLEGTFVEDGRTINKIRVIPKRKGQDLYSGIIFIREGNWNIHSVDLNVEQKMVNVRIRQVYKAVDELVWMPVSHDFDILFEALGGAFTYKYLVSVNDYKVKLNPKVDHAFYAKMISEIADTDQLLATEEIKENAAPKPKPALSEERKKKVEELMNRDDLTNKEMRELNKLIKMDATAKQVKPPLEIKQRNTEIADSAHLHKADYWKQNRPVPLTSKEFESFDEPDPDTIQADTTNKKARGEFSKIMFGENARKLNDTWTMKHNGLIGISTFGFNTVDGLLFSKKIKFTNKPANDKRLELKGNIDYAVARKSLLAAAEINYTYHPQTRSKFQIAGGRSTSDFNANDGIPVITNTINTLFLRQNFMKLYEKDFIKLSNQTDVVNGLVFSSSLEFAQRSELQNNSDFYISSLFGDVYSNNIPKYINGQPELVVDNTAFILELGLSYTPRYYYRMINKRKQMLNSKYPTFSLIWRQGLPNSAASVSQFQYIEGAIDHAFSIRLFGTVEYHIKTGAYIGDDKPLYADFTHFYNRPSWLNLEEKDGMFRGLGYYERSTDQTYLQTHVRYQHSRILLKRLPFMANSLVRESLFVNSLFTQGSDYYLGVGYGLHQVFLLFNVDFVVSFEGNKHHYTGFQIGFPIGGSTVRF